MWILPMRFRMNRKYQYKNAKYNKKINWYCKKVHVMIKSQGQVWDKMIGYQVCRCVCSS